MLGMFFMVAAGGLRVKRAGLLGRS
jgi:hypothetical protein